MPDTATLQIAINEQQGQDAPVDLPVRGLSTRPTPEIARNVMKFMLDRWMSDRQRLEVLRDQIRREPEYMKFDEAFVKMAAQVDDMWQAIDNAISDGPSIESLRGEE